VARSAVAAGRILIPLPVGALLDGDATIAFVVLSPPHSPVLLI
jgi:hypothetical protein